MAMFITQDIVLRFFFRKKKILKNGFSIPINSSIILAPTHRSRWDGLILTMAMGRRVTKKDCRFMVTKSEMRGIQGWFLKRLGCFSINQLSPSLSALRYAIDLIEKGEQLVVFPEGKINRYGKKLVLKEGLYRLARLATKKTTAITIIPIGIMKIESVFLAANRDNLYRPSLRTNFFPYLLIFPSGKITSCSPFSIRSIEYLNAESVGDN